MDKFGRDVFTIKGKPLKLPRTDRCTKIYKNVPLLVMDKRESYTYEITPFVEEKRYSNIESLLKIKEIIWYKFFDHGWNYIFENSRHYPSPFKLYLDYTLGLTLGDDNDVDFFIKSIRNSVFNYVTYTASPRLVSGANWIADGTLRMSDTYGYVIDPLWEEWAELDKDTLDCPIWEN